MCQLYLNKMEGGWKKKELLEIKNESKQNIFQEINEGWNWNLPKKQEKG